MSNKIFKAIWLVAITVFLASLIFIMGISYNYFTSLQKKQLKNETDLAARGVALSGMVYFDQLQAADYRITWIDGEGNVLFDNEADFQTMENHLERKEVKEALEKGYGQAVRFSDTLSDQQLYAAQRLPDGTVLRLSIVQTTVWALVLGFAQPICLVIFMALLLSVFLASHLARKIVKPINEIDPDHPEAYYGKENYKEVEPLLRHISAQRRQLKADQDQIEKTALIRQEFTTNVSHELKTPLHAISGYAELLANGLVKEEDVRPFARRIYDESSRLSQLVEDIIDLTRLDSGDLEMEWEDCDLYRIGENALDSLEAAAEARNVSLDLSGSRSMMKGIPQLLYSIVYNLCDNAIKYNYPGGWVKLVVTPSEKEITLSVKDSGIGIAKEDQDRIFERFYRVDKSHSKEVGGTGLGLSIVKHALLLHGGRIRLQSQPGQGSEFVVTFPLSAYRNFTKA